MDTCRGVSTLGSKINILNEKVDFLHLAKFEFEPNIRKYNLFFFLSFLVWVAILITCPSTKNSSYTPG